MTENFMAVEDHFSRLLEAVSPEVQKLYDDCRHVRSEVAFAGRNFVVYEMVGREPEVIDRIFVNDFSCNEADGTTCEITSKVLQSTVVIGYEPQKLFDYPVLVWLPLHAKLRWSAAPSTVHKGSLGFPLTVRTMSRLHLRERGVVYFETGTAFGQEFNDHAA
jgi:hypothetical protein